MTAKEKAYEFYNQMYYAIHLDGEQDYKDSPEKCALIAVENIISSITYREGDYDTFTGIEYWKEVKSELEKL